MSDDEIIRLNCKTKEGKITLMGELKKLPFFADMEKIRIEDVEKAIKKLSQKSAVKISYIMVTIIDDELHYSVMLKHTTKHNWINTVYGISIFESLSKALLIIVNEIRSSRGGK